jgi:hypothetical protein
MARAIRDAVRLTGRTDVADAMSSLRHGSVEGEPATTVDAVPVLGARVAGVLATLRSLVFSTPRALRSLVRWLPVALGRVKELAMQVSFSTRVLLAFSVVSVLVLAMLGGRTKSSTVQAQAQAGTTLTMAAMVPAPAPAAEEPPIELGDPPPKASPPLAPAPPHPANPAPAPSPKARGARGSVARASAEPKTGKSPSSNTAQQLLH